MIDLLYLTHNRRAFTEASMLAILRNTDWDLVGTVYLIDEASEDGAGEVTLKYPWPTRVRRMAGSGGPVAGMLQYLQEQYWSGPYFAKIDNDVIVPPNWLRACVKVVEENPELDLLGIEPPKSRTRAPWMAAALPAPENAYPAGRIGYAACDAIGGIGLMRRKAFEGRAPMTPHGPKGVGGFTDWQWRNKDVVKGWITPPLSLFLLDRLPFEPWASLSKDYIARGWQRPWTLYDASASSLWEWWV